MMDAFANSDVGLRRNGNEDSFLSQPERGVFAVADGLGGLSYGEVASKMAVDALAKEEKSSFDDLPNLIRRISSDINKKGTELGGGTIGTTLTLALVEGGYLRIAQVGDSVAFLALKDGTSLQLTREHTVAEEYRHAGKKSFDPYLEHVLTQCLGQERDVVPDVFVREFPAGARLLLCSDGITKTVDRTQIVKILREGINTKTIVDKLIKIANENGGPDNSTAVAVFA